MTPTVMTMDHLKKPAGVEAAVVVTALMRAVRASTSVVKSPSPMTLKMTMMRTRVLRTRLKAENRQKGLRKKRGGLGSGSSRARTVQKTDPKPETKSLWRRRPKR